MWAIRLILLGIIVAVDCLGILFLSILTRQGLQQKAFHSVRQLERFLKTFIRGYNNRCGPFEWTAGPKKLEKIIQLTQEYQNP